MNSMVQNKMENLGIKKVIDGNYCIGCGACAFLTNTMMVTNEFGEYVPDLENIANSDYNDVDFVCPQLNSEFNEDVLANEFVTSEHKNSKLGFYQSIYAGYVVDDSKRELSTSGGFGTWICETLIKESSVDYVIHAKPDNDDKENLFKYGISSNLKEVQQGAKTKYYVMEMSGILNFVTKNKGSYAIVGVPCFIKTIRRLQLKNPLIRERITYTISLICGHYKSKNWSKLLSWGAGVHYKELDTLEYRTKGDNIPANKYFVTATSKEGKSITVDTAEITGGKFNLGAMMLPGCEFCDDVVGETADLTIGDAWLPKFIADERGTNMLIVRNKSIENLLKKYTNSGEIYLESLKEEEAEKAQSGGFRQRRSGLSYRIHEKQKKNLWHPIKRVNTRDYQNSFLRKLIYKYRSKITQDSRVLFLESLRKDDIGVFYKKLNFDLKFLRFLEITSQLNKVIVKRLSIVVFKQKSQKNNS